MRTDPTSHAKSMHLPLAAPVTAQKATKTVLIALLCIMIAVRRFLHKVEGHYTGELVGQGGKQSCAAEMIQ